MSERKPYHFQPGHKLAKGRAGARNRLSNAFIEAVQKDWEANGEAVLRIVRCEDPSTYIRVVASLLPKELEIEHKSVSVLQEWLQWVSEPKVIEAVHLRLGQRAPVPQIELKAVETVPAQAKTVKKKPA